MSSPPNKQLFTGLGKSPDFSENNETHRLHQKQIERTEMIQN